MASPPPVGRFPLAPVPCGHYSVALFRREEADMKTSLTDSDTRKAATRLGRANRAWTAAYPGGRGDRQPVHTVYGGAHLFRADTARRLGEAALASLGEYAPDAETFARVLDLPKGLTSAVHARVVEKLGREPVEDQRLDFEDGYGIRADEEEDGHAVSSATEVAQGMAQASLPPFIGIRIKALTGALRVRSLRTLDLFLTTLADRTGGALPAHFVVTLPKVTIPEQVSLLVEALAALERRLSLAPGAIPIELMVETPQSLVGPGGQPMLPALVAAADGRCRGAHFGIYDFTAALEITALHQSPSHPACGFARHLMQVSLAGTGVTLSDGSTNVMPIPPHRVDRMGPPLTPAQLVENRRAVHHGWKTHYEDVRASLSHGYYQGWDLHPAQLPSRYAAVYAFYLEAREEASARLRGLLEKANQAALVGSVFDDAATGQGLLGFFQRGVGCGALTGDELRATGLSLEELRRGSFTGILEARRRGTEPGGVNLSSPDTSSNRTGSAAGARGGAARGRAPRTPRSPRGRTRSGPGP